MNRRALGVLAGIALIAVSRMHLHGQAPAEPADKYQWLEDVSGEKPMAWVKAENERSAKVLESDPHFAALEATALKVLESHDRLPLPSLNGSDVYNNWQDSEHVRGILRRTSLADYLTAQPHWQTVLDYDALAKKDNEKWVAKGRICLYPGDDLCLIALSAGGEDAVTLREFSLRLVPFGEEALKKSVREFMTHYHSERNHQGIGNLLIMPDRLDTNRRRPVRCRHRLGGMLNCYERAA
ncbi:MAG: hypothetical protein M3N54_13845 [Acidobacteriota bacterium]|nr:hypothetical protein [Acidobacteriota bacterium]